jgi:hypothetical protein
MTGPILKEVFRHEVRSSVDKIFMKDLFIPIATNILENTVTRSKTTTDSLDTNSD